MIRSLSTLAIAASLSAIASPAAAQTGIYVEGRLGISSLQDSDNNGTFDGAFTTGEGTTIPAGTTLPDGTPVGWETEFDSGLAGSIAVGTSLGAFRAEIEFAWQKNDVDSHQGVEAGGIALAAEDAGVLVTGADNLGVSVADLVANGQGEIKSNFLMVNGYYDVDTGTALTPFVGAGLGIGFVDVEYAPSDVGIIEDDASALAYQVILGAGFEVTPQVDITAAYRFRGTEDVEVEADLFSADFEIENRAHMFDIGVRYTF